MNLEIPRPFDAAHRLDSYRRLGVEFHEPDGKITPNEAMNFIARLIAKVEAQKSPALLLSKDEVCKLAGFSTRTFDRMKSERGQLSILDCFLSRAFRRRDRARSLFALSSRRLMTR